MRTQTELWKKNSDFTFWKKCNESSPLGVAIGRALSDLCTGNPFGLIHHSSCVRQPPHILYGHQHVAGILQDLHGLVMRNAPEATSIDLQNLIPYLQRWRQRDTPNETKWNATLPGTIAQGPWTTGTCLKELPAILHVEISITADKWWTSCPFSVICTWNHLICIARAIAKCGR